MTTLPKSAGEMRPHVAETIDKVRYLLDPIGFTLSEYEAVLAALPKSPFSTDPCDTCPYNAALQRDLADAQTRIENQTVEIRRLHKTRHGADEHARDLLKSQLAAMEKSRDEWKARYESADRQGYVVARERDEAREDALALAAWKESAMSVTPPLQAIAKEIGVPLGASIHDKILPWIKAAKSGLAVRNGQWTPKFRLGDRVIGKWDGRHRIITRESTGPGNQCGVCLADNKDSKGSVFESELEAVSEVTIKLSPDGGWRVNFCGDEQIATRGTLRFMADGRLKLETSHPAEPSTGRVE